MTGVENKTNSTQQVNFVDGSCVTLYPGEKADIDLSRVRVSEVERMKKFFKMTEKEQGWNKRQKYTTYGGK
jgi:hypothetical protein